MSMKPKIILTEEVTTQIMEYESKRDQLTMKRTEIEERFNMIQQVVQENAALELKAKKLIEEYLELQNAESIKSKQCFPEIRLSILQKIIEFIGATPPAEPAGGDVNTVEIPPDSKTDQPINSSDSNHGTGDAGGNTTPTA
jgi:hypothetical protein